jgi:hypothetical protein
MCVYIHNLIEFVKKKKKNINIMNILIRKGKEFIISKRERTGKFFKNRFILN